MDKKKIMCAALISVMALSLAACGNKKVDYGMNGGSDDADNAGGLEDSLTYPITAMLLLTQENQNFHR